MKYLLLTALTLLTLFSCDSSQKKLNEGLIEYKVTYLQDRHQQPIIEILPETITLNFKDNKTIVKIDGYANFFNLFYITDADEELNASILRIMGKSFLYKGQTGEVAYGYEDFEGMQIEHTDSTKTIAGFKAKKAIARFPENPQKESFPLYYTNEIQIENPNINNPFHRLSGVLLEFQVNLNGIDMKFEATKVENIDIPDERFELPEQCEVVSLEEMDSIMKEYSSRSQAQSQ